MKKLLALVLSLVLLLPMVALGETAEFQYVSFGDFSLAVSDADIYETYEKVNNQVMFAFFPNYDENAVFHPNFNAVWVDGDVTALGDVSVEAVGQSLVDGIVAGMEQQGVVCTDAQLLAAEQQEDGTVLTMFSMNADYTGMGMDLQTPLIYVQMWVSFGEKGSYIFTLTGTDLDTVQALLTRLDTLQVNE